VQEDVLQTPATFMTKAAEVVAYQDILGFKIASVTTTILEQPAFSQSQFDYAFWASLLYNFDYMGWGDKLYNENDATLDFRVRPTTTSIGAYNGDIVSGSFLHTRTTTTGTVWLDTDAHTGGFVLDPESLLAGVVSSGNADSLHNHKHLYLTEVTANDHHNEAHTMSGVNHLASGLTVGDILVANSASTFEWQTPNVLLNYTVETLPPVTQIGRMIFVTNETGGAVPAFSDGSNWRRVTDRNVVS